MYLETSIELFPDPQSNFEGEMWRVDIYDNNGEWVDGDTGYTTEAEARASGEEQLKMYKK